MGTGLLFADRFENGSTFNWSWEGRVPPSGAGQKLAPPVRGSVASKHPVGIKPGDPQGRND